MTDKTDKNPPLTCLQVCKCGQTLVIWGQDTKAWCCITCEVQRASNLKNWQIRHYNDHTPQYRPQKFTIYDEKPSQDSPKLLAKKSATVKSIRQLLLAQTAHESDQVLAIAKKCGVKEGMQLANVSNLLSKELHIFFQIIDPLTNNARGKQRRWDQDRIADSLGQLGILRADGSPGPTNSNISNTIRLAVFQRGPSCHKPNYQGLNHYAFH